MFAHFEICPDAEALATAAAARILTLGLAAVQARGLFRVALAGGDTPRRCYERLRASSFDWSRVEIYFGDERCLPQGDSGRNDTMARQAWLNHIDLPPDNCHPILAELGPEAAAAAYAQVLRPGLPLDLVLLGLGEDGHTASLFPGNAALQQTQPVVPVHSAPKPPAERVSLSLSVLNGARHKLFLVSGAGKREVMQRLAAEPDLPAARIQGAEWLVDRAAWPER
ncbi:MAG: 6-phosphogluconolactonase [Betaproteobacteria bacterium]|nr:6-phosphogluconolactonase [Betaproteobacteria bacterium]